MNPATLATIRATATMIHNIMEDDDAQAFLDTLDGETDAMDLIGHLVKARVEAQSLAAAAKDAAATFTARQRRMEARVAAMTKGLGDLLDAIGEDKVTHPLATISRTAPRASLNIENEAEIPSQLCKRVPDNVAIKKALEAGEDVPGATLVYGGPGIAVRVK